MDETQSSSPIAPQRPPKEDGQKLSSLHRKPGEKRQHNEQYSRFIRKMRIALPLVALCIIAVLFSWDLLQDDVVAPAKTEPGQTSPAMSKNELLNPNFNSMDNKNQPYTITAKRAMQDSGDELMLLDEPMADIVLNSGSWLAIEAKQGAYRQISNRLLLKGDVTLFHDAGYSAKTQELDVDLVAGTARTDLAVSGQGPLGTLDAQGMRANSKAGTLLFTGPAKLVIYDTGNTEVLSP